MTMTSDSNANLIIENDSGGRDIRFQLNPGNTVRQMKLTPSGVGINLTEDVAPTAELDVSGNIVCNGYGSFTGSVGNSPNTITDTGVHLGTFTDNVNKTYGNIQIVSTEGSSGGWIDWVSNNGVPSSDYNGRIRYWPSQGLQFYTNQVQQMVISVPSGYVGIGTDDPDEKLEVNGNIYINNGSTGSGQQGGQLIFDTGYGIGGPNKIQFNTKYGFGIDSHTLKYLSFENHKFYSGSTSSTNGTATMTIDASGSVVCSKYLTYNTWLRSSGSTCRIGPTGYDANNGTPPLDSNFNPKSYLNLQWQSGGESDPGDSYGNLIDMYFNTDYNEIRTRYNDLVFNATMGINVGIGTTTPSEKLDVSGNIVCNGTIMLSLPVTRIPLSDLAL